MTIIAISFLLATLIYSPSSTFDVLGEIKESGIDCIPEKGSNIVHCCYREYDSESGDTVAIYCATCYDNGGNLACDAYDKILSIKPDDTPPTPPPTGPFAPPLGGVLQEPTTTTPPPTSPFAPPVGGIFQEPLTTTTSPPLFGRNVPLQGGGVFGQPAITAATPVPTPPPLFGQAIPEGPATLAGEGENIQPMNTTFPTPQPIPDISPDLAPDETDDGRNDNIPDTGIIEQPETQQPENSSEGAETAGPLT
jgi:hypothetical protein